MACSTLGNLCCPSGCALFGEPAPMEETDRTFLNSLHKVYRIFCKRVAQGNMRGNHRVDRVLGFFSSRPNWDPPMHFLTHTPVCPPPPVSGGGLAGGRGGGGSQFGRDDRHCGTLGTVVLWYSRYCGTVGFLSGIFSPNRDDF